MKKQTAGRMNLGEFAPQFAALNDDVLFGEVWAREGHLSLKLRSMITIATLMGKGCMDSSFRSHLEMGKNHGISKDEMVELITHVGFYAGWPNAWAAFRMAKEVYEGAKEEEGHGGFFGIGEENVAFAPYFTGKSYLKPITKSPAAIANVTFEPGCRNNWHIHNAKKGGGQCLICVEGEGWYKEGGKAPQELKPGDIVMIPAGVKHYHGAKRDCWFSHLAFELPGEDTSTTWCEEVDDQTYPR